MRSKALLGLVAGAASLSLAVSGCGANTSQQGNAGESEKKGGTLYYLTSRPPEHLDPQRIYIGRDLSNLGRLSYRSLVQFPVTEDGKKAVTPMPDMATDTGKSTEGGKVWSFTIKDGVKWEDGKPVKCEDFKYGVSRSFATDIITGGPNYILTYLDVPKDDKGLPLYNGPYKKAHQADFDKAVTCEGNTITYRFNKAWPDFPSAIAMLRSFDPYRADKDKGAKSDFDVFSNGPYKLEGKWEKGKGATFVRNDQYDASTDGVRKALPDKIVFEEVDKNEVIAQRLIANRDKDQYAVTDRGLPPAFHSQVTGEIAKRSTNPDSPYVSYLVPNMERMTNPKVRKAFAMATNRDAYVTAGGGEKTAIVAYSIVNPALPSYQKNPNFEFSTAGDPEGAKKLLEESGVKMPVKLKYSYSSSDTADKQAQVLQSNWKKAGFDVTLNPLTDTYYDVIQKPDNDADVMWGGWGADWPTAATVLPALFDSRVNLTENSNGQDYGRYKSDEANALMDQATSATKVEEASELYRKIDAKLGEDTAYIPLVVMRFYMLYGSKVTNYIDNPAVSMYPDLGSVGVQQ